MGVLKAFGNLVLDSMKNKQEKIMYYKNLYSSHDDQELYKKYKIATTAEAKYAIGLLLKERGNDLETDE